MRSPSSHGSSDQDFVDFLENELELAEEGSDQQANEMRHGSPSQPIENSSQGYTTNATVRTTLFIEHNRSQS